MIIESKAVKSLEVIHRTLVMKDLKDIEMKLGFIINFFSHPQVTIERFIR